jgi:hypothetical protein
VNPRQKILTTLALVALLTTCGCDNREAEIAREAANRQAQQNQTMATLQQEVVIGTRRLAENDAQARKQALEVHQDLQAERAQMNVGWDSLEAERQSIGRSRRVDSFLTALITGGGGALAALFALAFAWLAVFGRSREDDAAEALCELLAEEWLADPIQLGSSLAQVAPDAKLLGAASGGMIPPLQGENPDT